jgi:hypothetical protein
MNQMSEESTDRQPASDDHGSQWDSDDNARELENDITEARAFSCTETDAANHTRASYLRDNGALTRSCHMNQAHSSTFIDLMKPSASFLQRYDQHGTPPPTYVHVCIVFPERVLPLLPQTLVQPL